MRYKLLLGAIVVVFLIAVVVVVRSRRGEKTFVIVQNDGSHQIVVSQGPTRSQTPVAVGDVRQFAFGEAAKTIWIDGGDANSSLEITLGASANQAVVVVATAGSPQLPDPVPSKNRLLSMLAPFASKTQLASVDGVKTAVEAAADYYSRQNLRFSNQTARVVRVDVADERGVSGSADLDPGFDGAMQFVFGSGTIARVDISDARANRGYRVYFTKGFSGPVEFTLPSEPFPTATIAPLDPRLCTLSSECSTAAKAPKTPPN